MINHSGRFFVAIALPERVKEGISQIQKDLSSHTECFRWVQKDLLHMTLLFCGAQDREVINVFSSNLSRKVSAFESFTINLGQLGAFPNTNNPRVLWMGISKGDKQLIKLHQLVTETFLECPVKAPTDIARFHPHITLGRKKDSQSLQGLSLNHDNVPDIGLYQIPVVSIFLMESTLTAKGPEYRTVQFFNLHQ